MSESSGVSVASPGPRRYPLLGVFPSARKDPLGFFLESARTHGDVVALPFGMRRLYLLSHPDHIKYVLQEHDGLFQKGPAAARIKPLFGESLTTVDGDDWSRRRRAHDRGDGRGDAGPMAKPTRARATARRIRRDDRRDPSHHPPNPLRRRV